MNDPSSLACQKLREQEFRDNDRRCRIGPDVKIGDLLDFWAERKWREGKIVGINLSSP
jgi:ribosomal 50S subunit-recycling heat shock protein